MRGRSVVYSLARDRPIDMIPDIWPCARRLIQKKMPTKATRMRMVGSHCPRALCWGVLKLTVAMSFFMTVTSFCERGVGALHRVALTVLFSLPVMIPVVLSTVADWTWCAST